MPGPDALLKQFEEFCQYIRILSKDQGLVPLRLWSTQRYLIQELLQGIADDVRDFVILKPRQVGATTVLTVFTLFWHLRTRALQGGYVAHLDTATQLFRDNISEMAAHIDNPRFTYPIRSSNRYQLAWTHGSRLQYATAGTKENKTLGRSKGLTYLFADEVAYWGGMSGVASLKATLSERHPARLSIWASTANGYNLFHDLWTNAQRAITTRAIFSAWWRHELYRTEAVPKGEQIKAVYWDGVLNAEEQAWQREIIQRWGVTLAPGQWAWWRWMLAEKCADDLNKMHEDYPCLVAETRVSTERGIIPIGSAGRARWSESGEIVGWYPQPVLPIVEIVTEAGRRLRGTPRHPVEQPDGTFVEMGASRGRYINLRPPRFADEVFTLWWSPFLGVKASLTIGLEWARFLGYFIGDGAYHQRTVSIAWDAKDGDVGADIGRLMRLIFGAGRERALSAGGREHRVGSVEFAAMMRRLGIWHDDKPHRRVCVPDAIWRSPKPIVREFLRGLFEADGFIHTTATRIQLFSKHRAFLEDVQILLLGFGVTSRIRRQTKTATIRGVSHAYVGTTLDLRAEEARVFNQEIGFIGARKRSRVRPPRQLVHGNTRPLEMIDRVVSVEPAGEAAVYDLQIADRHTFSANGIVVHNTLPEHAFQATGHGFLSGTILARLRTDMLKAPVAQCYRYHLGPFIEASQLLPTSSALAQLRIWEEPRPNEQYVISCDPAYGASPDSDYSTVTVWRCERTRITQVAEFSANEITVSQFAWIIAHLCGAYQQPFLMLELQGPGYPVWQEILRLQAYGTGTGRLPSVHDLMGAVQYYVFRRADAMAGRGFWGWQSTNKNKAWVFHRLKDHLLASHVVIRSADLVAELAAVRQDGNMFGAQDGAHDDRVITLALAVEAWQENVAPMLAMSPLTIADEPPPTAPPVHERMVQDYFARLNAPR